MISIDIYGAFNFADNEVHVGRLAYERIKGAASYIFEYAPIFLQEYPQLSLSRDLGMFQGPQSTRDRIFSMFGDSCPDRWGKVLIDKREQLRAMEKRVAPRVFSDFDYMVRLDDRTRMGALRFYNNGKPIGVDTEDSPIPITANLEMLIRESQAYEAALKKGLSPDKRWIDNLCAPGSSLGGARPKANIIDDGELYIAKFPSVKDSYDIALWEQFASVLARRAGITVPDTRLVKIPSYDHHVFLSKRFDRADGKRIHYASSLTLTGFKDGDGVSTGKGYIDIVNAMIANTHIRDINGNLAELFRRVAFNIAVGNSDDHFRNHGFLLTENGWTLSPAFDMNPSNSLGQSLLITPNTNIASLGMLLSASDHYMIDRSEAKDIIAEVQDAVSYWKAVADELNIPQGEQSRFSQRFTSVSASKISITCDTISKTKILDL